MQKPIISFFYIYRNAIHFNYEKNNLVYPFTNLVFAG
jgi:hypothetical protein